MAWIYEYGLFLAKIATLVVAIMVVVGFIVSQGLRKKNVRGGALRLLDLSEQYRDLKQQMQQARQDSATYKIGLKQQKKELKKQAKEKKQQAKAGVTPVNKSCLYVIDFNGSMDAHEVVALREEITAILSVIKPEDEVLLRLESPGGVVHGYGLAASQLERLRQRNIQLTVAVDKVAASGGYMMACVAQRIVAAPFAIIGSIGVVAQVPNFHRLLQKNAVDIELHTAGEFKRTLTLFGENTEQGREKFKQELNETHELFKQFIHRQRPELDMSKVATGEHWFGTQAKQLNLVDEIGTSDDLLLAKIEQCDVISVRFIRHKKLIDKFFSGMAKGIDHMILRWWRRGQHPTL